MQIPNPTERRIDIVRRFNRLYTREIGVLHERILKSKFSLTEVRVLYELAHRPDLTATNLVNDLGLDPGYLSRILLGFEKRNLIARKTSGKDGRQSHLSLTKKGQKAFEILDASSDEEVGRLLSKLSADRQRQMTAAMQTIERLLDSQSTAPTSYVLRNHQPGDIGWIVHRHGVLYSREYGWDERFEALVAGIVAKFIEHYDPKVEHCWIAEKDNEIVGCVFLVRHSKAGAKLRLLLVEPNARGLGIGKHLVNECIRFARQVGYKKITLWTNSVLKAARHIYAEAGFHLVDQGPHHSFGHDLVQETWELEL